MLRRTRGSFGRRLSLIESEIGTPHQRTASRGIIRCHGNANADADMNRAALDQVGPLDQFDDPYAELFSCLFHSHNNSELVPSEPRKGLTRTKHARYPFGYEAEQRVPYSMTETIVDSFEAVKVKQQKCGRCCTSSNSCKLLVKLLFEEAAVPDAG